MYIFSENQARPTNNLNVCHKFFKFKNAMVLLTIVFEIIKQVHEVLLNFIAKFSITH